MQTLKIYLKLIRLEQWYKNLILFAALLFTANIYSIGDLIIGFFGFSCISSVTYIINDWIDRKKDRLHPIKKERPLASGKISGKKAIAVAGILFLTALMAGWHLGLFYGVIVLSYFLLTNFYSFGLKNIPFLDALMIAINFALRMMAGMENFPDSNTLPYFGLLIGVILIFLSHKRSGDLKLLKEKAIAHKPVLKFYTKRNNYIFRIFAYLIVLVSLYGLWQDGVAVYKIIGIYLQLLTTSFIFSENPEYTSRPQYLLKSKIWDFLLVINIVLFIIF